MTTSEAEKFFSRLEETLSQTASVNIKPDSNVLVMRKAGNITESDLQQVLKYAKAAYGFIEHNRERPTL